MVGTRNKLHIKVTTITYETDYEVPCIAGIRVRKRLRQWVVFLYLCVWCPSLHCGFVFLSVWEVWFCLCKIHKKQTSWDAADMLSWLRDETRSSTVSLMLIPREGGVARSNQCTTPSTHHLHAGLKLTSPYHHSARTKRYQYPLSVLFIYLHNFNRNYI